MRFRSLGPLLFLSQSPASFLPLQSAGIPVLHLFTPPTAPRLQPVQPVVPQLHPYLCRTNRMQFSSTKGDDGGVGRTFSEEKQSHDAGRRGGTDGGHQSQQTGQGQQGGGRRSPTDAARFSAEWWKEWAIVFIVFGITGSASVKVTKPVVNALVGEGSWTDGPWSWRGTYLVLTMPMYSMILVAVGTMFRRGLYFRRVALRMWRWAMPKDWRRKLLSE
ncbi:hypothetical protein M427DRAFT_52532 [Gonapodya prolifera JEL478]|uniref:DUF6787 domain-containing protein n=1 Tax=Gonapodya prolifera (strain JEL478) TaxID=1344416 RepID=A0A139AU87_GONPJ|nr:hypothetical protein M427DRAFT_52532 [Gonapodya prolifera JEL478]|eukprot:KXS20306.1 hypothetical protein M427DRAFT_52532 [Gonapodya prolifera JEL478]